MNYKIVNGILYKCDQFGNILRKICDNVHFATLNDTSSIFLITSKNGNVETRDQNGNLIRVISKSENIEARFVGSDILVRKSDGRNCILDKFGNIRRYI